MIKVECPSCGKNLNLPDKYAGKKGKCPGCQEMLTIPTAMENAAAAAPDPAKARKPAPPPLVEEVDEEEPEEEAEPEEEERVVQKPAKKRARPAEDEDEEEEEPAAQKPMKKRPPDEEEDKDRPRKKKKKKNKKPKGEWAECPSCGACDAKRVHWTLWGGMIGPAFISTVRCNDCGSQYNGVRGDYNTVRIIIFMVVNFGLAAVIAALVFYLKTKDM